MKRMILQIIVLVAVIGCEASQNSPKMSGYGHFDNVDSVKLLEKSQCFRVDPAGVAGVIPNEMIALQRIMKRDDASAVLEELYSKGSPAGKLYALLGLRFVNKARYEELIPQLKQNTDKINTQSGCIIFDQTIKAIIGSMEAGNYDYYVQREFK
jgi:hypothetical protein